MGRTSFRLTPEDIAGMFGEGLRLVDVCYNHDQGMVDVILEGPELERWHCGCAPYRVAAKPLPTAYIMRKAQ